MQNSPLQRLRNWRLRRAAIKKIHNIVSQFGKTALIITGGFSLDATGRWDEIARILDHASIVLLSYIAAG